MVLSDSNRVPPVELVLTDAGPIAPLLVDSRTAARLLGISERTLWGITAPRGTLPVVKINRACRYALTDLQAYIARQKVSEEAPA
jgi:hypothetical protein